VDADAYRAFTAALVEGVAADERVVGLVAVGSMAERDYGPDEWSDHDFFVVVRPGEQEALRRSLDWLPRPDEIALSFRETEHGLKVLYENGHLLEFAVFDLDEVALAGVNRFRVLLDRGGVAARMQEVADATAARPRDSDERVFGMLVTAVLVGAGRHRRGEELSGAYFVKGLAVRHLLELLARAVPAERTSLLDDLDAFRRFDLVHPVLARELAGLLRSDTLAAARGLLTLTERELRERRPGLPWHALQIVRDHVSR
jgi:hypothetical protein